MRCWAKDRTSAPRTGKLCPGEAGASPIFPGGKAPGGSWSRMPGWWGCPRAPWNTNRHLRTQETAPYPAAELPKRLQGPRLDLEELGGAWAAAPHGGGSEARSSSEGPPAEEEVPAERVAGLWDQLSGAWVVVPRRRLCGLEGESKEQALEHRAPRHSLESGLPLGQADPGKAHNS